MAEKAGCAPGAGLRVGGRGQRPKVGRLTGTARFDVYRKKNTDRFEAIQLAPDSANAAAVVRWLIERHPTCNALSSDGLSARMPTAICVSSHFGLIRPGDWAVECVLAERRWLGLWLDERFRATFEEVDDDGPIEREAIAEREDC